MQTWMIPLKNKSNNDLSSDVSQNPIVLDQAPEPRGKYGAQIDTDLDNY
jgi:cell wall assembly regulator SMI1